jgi:sugar phosphate permease
MKIITIDYFFEYFKSLCWAAANKGLGAWVSDDQRNTIFGYFGTCPFIGGIVGTAFAVCFKKLK